MAASVREIAKKDITVILPTLLRSDLPYSSTALCIAKEMSRDNRVYYVDHPFTWKDLAADSNNPMIKSRKPVWFGKEKAVQQYDAAFPNLKTVVLPLMTPVNFLPPDSKLHSFFSLMNDRKVAGSLNRMIADEAIDLYVLFNIHQPFYGLKSRWNNNPLAEVYYTVDDIREDAYTSRHGHSLELKHMQKADLILATSPELVKNRSAETGKQVKLLANAADYDLFHKTVTEEFEKPAELKPVIGKIIMYTGNLGTRLDYELLEKTADAHLDKTLVLVGPVDEENFGGSALLERANVIHTGAKKIEELPAYLKYADCAIIPFELSPLTKSIYPLKINEYLAAGLPVVSTGFSDLSDFSDVIHIASDYDEFIKFIDKALISDDNKLAEKRYFKASTNTWKNRVDTFWHHLDDVLKTKNMKLLFDS